MKHAVRPGAAVDTESNLWRPAQVDGANRFRVLVSAEMPYIANVLAVTSVLGLIWTANYFDGIYSGLFAHAFNNLVALGIAYAAFNMALAILLVRNFFDNIPMALDDAASLDGCSRFQTFWYVLRPLVTPAVAAASVFVFINAWQDYLLASSLITSSGRFTVTVGLYTFEGAFTTNWGAILASSVLVSIPS